MTEELNKPQEEHSPYGGSQAHRWITCPGSIRLIASLGPQERSSSPAAERGTAMHEVAAACLRQHSSAINIGQVKEIADLLSIETGYVCEQGDLEMILDYYSLCHEIRLSGGFKLFIEHPVDLAWISPMIRGTLDFGFISTNLKTLYIGDLKTGFKPVSAFDNEQLMLYALGIIGQYNTWGVEKVVMFIAQPNLLDWRENQSVMLVSDLRKWEREVLTPAYAASLKEDAPLCPGDSQCQYCLAKGVCSTRAASMLPSVVQDYSSPLPPAETLAPDQIAEILDKTAQFRTWLDSVWAYAEEGSRTGRLEIPGYGVTESKGRKSRSWTEEASLSISLMYGFEAFDLKSPAALEKVLGRDAKEFLKDYIEEKEGKATFKLTKVSEPAKCSAIEDFS